MQTIRLTVNNLSRQPGCFGTGGVCPSAHQPLAAMTVRRSVRFISIANEQTKSYTSDLGMT